MLISKKKMRVHAMARTSSVCAGRLLETASDTGKTLYLARGGLGRTTNLRLNNIALMTPVSYGWLVLYAKL
jgi:hypothetical protein